MDSPRARLAAIVDLAFTNPYLTVAKAPRQTGLTNQAARNVLRAAQRQGWLEEVGMFGRGGRTYWLAPAVLAVIEAPTVYDVEPDEDTGDQP